ncbi:MAG: extracellular solute-binding protein [Nitrososphaerota archaeon]|nr:extracellular solute-binding protein [Nitrososphaerota archaeon]
MASNKAVIAIVVILVLIIAGIGAYAVTLPSAKTVTSTVTSTTTVGGGGTGSTVTSTVTTTTTAGGAPNYNQTLVDLAKAEGGSVTVYGVMGNTAWGPINNVLLQSFPWMKVNYVALSPGNIATRGITEYQAGHVQADVFYDTLGPVVQLIQAGAVQPYNDYVETMMNYSSVDPQMMWHNGFGLPIVLEYNKNLVKPSQLPTSIEAINSSQWSGGKLVIDTPSSLNTAGTLFASLYYTDFHSNNASWTAWLQSIKALNPLYTSSSGTTYTDIATGQADIGIGLLNDVISGGSSSPVGVVYFNTTYTLPVMTAMAKNAPHPYTAELLIQWFSSYAGQVAVAITGRTPNMGVVAQQYFGQYIPSNTTLVAGGAQGTYYSDANGWASYYQTVFGQ